MYDLEETNIIISGWTSTGGTITALILAYLLQKKFVYAGGTMKFMAEQLGYDPKSSDMVKYENKYGEKWDILWENYIAWKIKSERNLLVNSKLAGFFVEHQPWLFEGFIIADNEIRQKRAGVDKRTEDIAIREQVLIDRWKTLFKVDFSDTDYIRETHDYLIDNSELSISQTVFQLFRVMRGALGLSERLTLFDIEKVEAIAEAKGKDFFYKKLNEKNLLINHKEVFIDWINNFSEDLKETAPEWRAVVIKHAQK